MANTLRIEIETDSEEGIYPLLQHVFREITEGENYNNPANSDCTTQGGWLVLHKEPLKGKYQWVKSDT